MVRVVGEAQEVGVEGARVPEAAADVLLRRRLAQGHVVLVDADAPEEQGFSIEEKLAPHRADLAETDPGDHLVRAEAGHHRVELGRGGRPEDRVTATTAAPAPAEIGTRTTRPSSGTLTTASPSTGSDSRTSARMVQQAPSGTSERQDPRMKTGGSRTRPTSR